MSTPTTQVWRQVLDRLRQRVPPGAFVTFTKYTNLEHVNEQEAVIGVGSPFIREWLRDHYMDALAASLTECLGEAPQVAFRISAEPFRRLRESEEAADLPPRAPSALPLSSARTPSQSAKPALHPDFRLDRFRPGLANRVLHAACRRVAEAPGGEFNPLLVYGPSGTGKTHLLQGICHAAREAGCTTVRYLSAEAFATGFVRAVEEKRRAAYRRAFERVDLLAVDDIQFLATGNKAATQDAFLHMFDDLLHRSAQLVLASEVDPRELKGLAHRLAKRFVCGLSLRVAPPDQSAREDIVRLAAAERGFDLPDEAVALIADQTAGCARELGGVLHRLAALARFEGLAITREVVDQLLPRPPGPALARLAAPTMEQIADAVSEAYGVPVETLRGSGRQTTARNARAAAMLIVRELTHASLAQIGRFFGGRSHATVHAALKNARNIAATDDALRRRLELIRRSL